MEDVLNLYEQPYNPARPVVCFDERPCQLTGEVVAPIPIKPGKVFRQDYHYERNGTCVTLLAYQPLTGKRLLSVRKQKTKKDYALFMETLAQTYPEAEEIILIQDNLNTHNPSSFYETFPPEKAFRLSRRFQMRYTPKKASWLNMAEIEFSVLAKQCLNRRLGDLTTFCREVYAWAAERNRNRATVSWQFTKNNARKKFNRFYKDVRN